MTLVRRPRYIFALVEDEPLVDLHAIFSRGSPSASQASITLISLGANQPLRVDLDALTLLKVVPIEEWLDLQELVTEHSVQPELAQRLIDHGILLSDSSDQFATSMRRREQQLAECQWDPVAALYFISSRWSDERVPETQVPKTDADVQDGLKHFERQVEQSGPPPGHFHHLDSPGAEIELPLRFNESPLRDLLRARRSVRYFDTSRQLALDDFSNLLYYTFGCQGFRRVVPDVVMLKKTSPSGGAMHAIEAYPLILNVEGLQPGLYHYNVEHHALHQISKLDREMAEEFVDAATAGQSYACSAHAVTFLTARFNRHNWKYGGGQRGYKSVLMSAAHMSQSFYLLCAEMKLGAFFTAALNDLLLEEKLGLEFIEEGVVGALACGVPKESGFDFSLQTEPYQPRVTKI